MTDKLQEQPQRPYARVRPDGRWAYLIIIHDSWTMFRPSCRTLGRRHAAAKARAACSAATWPAQTCTSPSTTSE